jgi:hypothetical protein
VGIEPSASSKEEAQSSYEPVELQSLFDQNLSEIIAHTEKFIL